MSGATKATYDSVGAATVAKLTKEVMSLVCGECNDESSRGNNVKIGVRLCLEEVYRTAYARAQAQS